MTTIREIAELAGVSRGTVDRVLNNRGAVNADTARKVMEIAKALDYRPNRAGIVLAAQKKNLKLGVILFDTKNPFFDEVLEGVQAKEEELASYNCSIIIRRVGFDASEQIAAIDEVVSQGINGIILSPYNDEPVRQKINELFQKGIPVITTNTDIRDSKRLAFVGSDFYRCGETAAGLMHLITGGSAKIGIISGSSKVLCHTDRIAGFEDCIRSRYTDLTIVASIENSDDEFESYEKTSRLLQMHPEITALYFTAGGVYGGCRAVQNAGRKDIRIISYDKVPTTKELVEQGVISATICQQPFVQGSKPLELLFSYLTTGELPEKENNYTAVDIRIRENI